MEVIQPVMVQQPVVVPQQVMVQQPMMVQQVMQPQSTVMVSAPPLVQLPMQRQSIMATISPPVGVISSQLVPHTFSSQVVPQIVQSKMDVLPPRLVPTSQALTASVLPPVNEVITTIETTRVPLIEDIPLANPPGQPTVNQSVMSFHPGMSSGMQTRVMTSQLPNVSRLLQNDIVNSENFNSTVYRPQCMDMKSRSIVMM